MVEFNNDSNTSNNDDNDDDDDNGDDDDDDDYETTPTCSRLVEVKCYVVFFFFLFLRYWHLCLVSAAQVLMPMKKIENIG